MRMFELFQLHNLLFVLQIQPAGYNRHNLATTDSVKNATAGY
eukprot:SAG11_NODE_21371_length_426_cov_1.574924_1_plen_41_part_10